jgi:hypothetical protein
MLAVARGSGIVKSLVVAFILVAGQPAAAQSPVDLEQRVAELERKMKLLDPAFGSEKEAKLEERLKNLEAKMDAILNVRGVQGPKPDLATVATAAPTTSSSASPLRQVSVSGDFQKAADSESRLPVAGYMEFHVNKDAGDSFRPDFHRFVLLFGHSFSDRIKFWSELEVEHALVEGGKETGELAVEQAYLDFLITPKLNLRAGMLLTPVGILNERHEPPSFNGVERPFVETFIIPTTWRELGFGLTGDLGKGFRYRTYLTSALDGSRFDAEFGIAEGKTDGFNSSMRNPATVGRMEYAGVRRLTLGASLYSGLAGFNTPGVNPRVTIANFDGRYSFRRVDLRGLFANTWLSKAAELNSRVQLQTGVNPNVAQEMRGYYLEPAYHVLPRRFRQDIIVFGRYERYNTQQTMPDGYLPLAQFNRSSWVTGLTYKPIPDVAIKFDYAFNRNASQVVNAINAVNLGIGWWF